MVDYLAGMVVGIVIGAGILLRNEILRSFLKTWDRYMHK